MNKKSVLVLSFALMLLLSRCSSVLVSQAGTPPGQAKKQTGNQSAKTLAPGQQKKAAGEQSAKSFAPGQQKKSSTAPGQAKKKK